MDDQLLPPSIADPSRRQVGTRHASGRNAGGARTEVYLREFSPVITDEPSHRGGTDTAPTPMETVLASLVGCKGATIFYIAQAMHFRYAGVEFEASSVTDLRGPRGVKGIRRFFESVDLAITLFTDESAARVRTLARNVEYRCPVANLLRAAQVELEVDWHVRPEAHAPHPQTQPPQAPEGGNDD